MKHTSVPQVMETAVFRLLVACGAMMVATTIWVCLVAGLVVTLRPALGLGGALFAVGGGLFAIVILALAISKLARPRAPAQPSGMNEAALAMALRVMQSPTGRRLALGAVGAVLVAAAVLMSGPDKTPPE